MLEDILDFDIDDDQEMGYDVLLIDGRNVLHRAAHTHADLGVVREDGEVILTGATFGFLQIVTSFWERYSREGSQLYICWDGGYRHRLKLFPDYKAKRRNRDPNDLKPHQKDLPNQEEAVRRILRVAGWRQALAKGFEADDVMATLAHRFGDKRVAIYTMDKDLHQCVTDTVHVISPAFGSGSDTIWTLPEVTSKWEVGPERVPEFKALAGDSSDGIPGCPSCGETWTKKLLALGSLQDVLDRAEKEVLTGHYDGKDWTAKALTSKIKENRGLIETCLKLATVVSDAPVEITHPDPRPARLRVALERLRFHSLLQPESFEILAQIA